MRPCRPAIDRHNHGSVPSLLQYMNSLIRGSGAKIAASHSAGGYGGLMDMVLAGLGSGFAVSSDTRLLGPQGIALIPIVDPTPHLDALVVWRRAEERAAVTAARSIIIDLHREGAWTEGGTPAGA